LVLMLVPFPCFVHVLFTDFLLTFVSLSSSTQCIHVLLVPLIPSASSSIGQQILWHSPCSNYVIASYFASQFFLQSGFLSFLFFFLPLFSSCVSFLPDSFFFLSSFLSFLFLSVFSSFSPIILFSFFHVFFFDFFSVSFLSSFFIVLQPTI
jgi:hypothetical protein